MNLLDIIFPIPYAFINERELKNKINRIQKPEILQYMKVNHSKLEHHNNKIMKIGERIEDKAKVNTIAVSIAISIAFGIFSLLKYLSSTISFIIIMLFMLVFYFFISSGWSAFRVLKVKERYDLYLNSELKSPNERKQELIESILKNQYSNLIIVNYLYSSYYQFVKGLIIIFVSIIYIGLQLTI